ncbi:phosphotransferase [Streptomyces sp. NPDC090025]|uniref:phosphotransferase n=1 Tax=Streptomyces sp. NPDC090025 TaxID=3365922 RepID=UPI0038362808
MTPPAWVSALLADAFGLRPVGYEEGAAGTATRNYVATAPDGGRWFVKSHPPGTDVARAESAARLGEFAGGCGVPVAPVLLTRDGTRAVAAGPDGAVSVNRFLADTVTADGRVSGPVWEEVGLAVGRLHRGLAGHPSGPPRPGPRDRSLDPVRASGRLTALVRHYEASPPETAYERWAAATAKEKLARLPEVERLLAPVPETMLTQVVHGDLSGPNLLLRDGRVAALIDFHPPAHRGPVWELGRVALDPRTVLTDPDWPTGLALLAAAYHSAHPALGAPELATVARVTAAQLTLTTYPLNAVADGLGPLTPDLTGYGHARYEAAAELRDRLPEAEEALRARLG